jgi:hypothetical protein
MFSMYQKNILHLLNINNLYYIESNWKNFLFVMTFFKKPIPNPVITFPLSILNSNDLIIID